MSCNCRIRKSLSFGTFSGNHASCRGLLTVVSSAPWSVLKGISRMSLGHLKAVQYDHDSGAAASPAQRPRRVSRPALTALVEAAVAAIALESAGTIPDAR